MTIPSEDIEAAVVIQHNTHKLVSLTGAKDYKTYSFYRDFQSFRQPGSTIKPLLVYIPSLDTTEVKLTEATNASSYYKNSYCPPNSGGRNSWSGYN